MEKENFKLELTHQNGKKSELLPISFKYRIEDFSHMTFDLSSLTYVPKTDYITDDISNFYEIFGKSSFSKFYHINSIVCKFNKNDEIHNIFLLQNTKKIPFKKDIVSEGKMQFETIDEIEKFPVINDFYLFNCIPISPNYVDNTIEISMDYIKLIKTPKSKY